MPYIMNFVLLLLIYVLFCYYKWKRYSRKEFVLRTTMYTYIVMVLFVTSMPFPIPFAGMNYLFLDTANFIPFRDVRMNYAGAEREIILNIIMMIPFGFLYPTIRRSGLIKTVTITFVFSLWIESFQLLGASWASMYARSFDVTDLITNTMGGLIGFIMYLMCRPILELFLGIGEERSS